MVSLTKIKKKIIIIKKNLGVNPILKTCFIRALSKWVNIGYKPTQNSVKRFTLVINPEKWFGLW